MRLTEHVLLEYDAGTDVKLVPDAAASVADLQMLALAPCRCSADGMPEPRLEIAPETATAHEEDSWQRGWGLQVCTPLLEPCPCQLTRQGFHSRVGAEYTPSLKPPRTASAHHVNRGPLGHSGRIWPTNVTDCTEHARHAFTTDARVCAGRLPGRVHHPAARGGGARPHAAHRARWQWTQGSVNAAAGRAGGVDVACCAPRRVL